MGRQFGIEKSMESVSKMEEEINKFIVVSFYEQFWEEKMKDGLLSKGELKASTSALVRCPLQPIELKG